VYVVDGSLAENFDGQIVNWQSWRDSCGVDISAAWRRVGAL